MKQAIRLKETELRNMIAESVKRILNEGDWAMDPGMAKYYTTHRPTYDYSVTPKVYNEREVQNNIAKATRDLTLGKSPKEVFNYVDSYDLKKYGFCKIKIGNKYNILFKNNTLLSDKWFDDIDFYRLKEYGICDVKLKDVYNVMDKNGDLLSDIWFDKIKFDAERKCFIGYKNGQTTVIGQPGIKSKIMNFFGR